MKTGVEKIIQAKGGDAPAKNQTGVQKIIELLGGDPPAKNQTGVDKIVEILEGGGGGGNPNRVQIIEGTLANPWGDVGSELCEAIIDNNANAWLLVDASALGYGEITYPILADTGTLRACVTAIGACGCNDSEAEWYETDTVGVYRLSFAYNVIADPESDPQVVVLNLEEYAEYLPTTLTIIWHPLPDQS